MKALERRSVLKKLFASIVGVSGLSFLAKADTKDTSAGKEVLDIVQSQDTLLMSVITKHGGLVYLCFLHVAYVFDRWLISF